MKRTNSYEGEYTIKYQEHLPNSIGAKLVCIDDRWFTLPSIIFKGKNCINEFIKWVFRQKEWINQVIYQHFNKKLIMTNPMKMKKFMRIHTYVGYANKN